MKGVVFFVLVVVFLSSLGSAALGVIPGKKVYDYRDGLKDEIPYKISSDHADRLIHVTVEGDLSAYVTLNKNFTLGSGTIVASLVLPSGIILVGPQKTYIVASESQGEGGTVGARTVIKALLLVEAPFPGQYVELVLGADHVNEGEAIPVSLQVWSRGTENVSVQTGVRFYDSTEQLVDQVIFPLTDLSSQERRIFSENLSTQGWNPGSYRAEGYARYGGEMQSENRTVFVGTLFVNVTNVTERLPQDGIQRYLIHVESLWNNPLEVYAEVNLTRKGEEASFFKTPSVSLDPRRTGVLAGFVDTNGLGGSYVAEIVVSYGKKRSLVERELFVGGGGSWWILVVLLLVLLGISYQHWKQKRS